MTAAARDRRFDGRVVLVTGAAQGIGRATALRFATEGAAVGLADVDIDGARTVADEISAAGGTARAEAVDLADPPQRNRLIGRLIDAWGRIDVLVNNAAYLGARVPLAELAEDDWARVLATNLTAPALLSRDAAADMARRGTGVVINLTSLQEHLPVPAHVAYVASKGGVAALTRALAVELAPCGVRVNAVTPGVIETPTSVADLAGGPGMSMPPATLLRRSGSPDEVASAVAYLASDEAAYITGELLRVDGGRSLSRRPDPFAPEQDPASTAEDAT